MIFYNAGVKNWDVIVVGGGIIGLSISLELKKHGAAVLVVERGEPGREASYAAAGMLADTPIELPSELHALARASAKMYPEFVQQVEEESGLKVDLRDQGTIFLSAEGKGHSLPAPLTELDQALPSLNSPQNISRSVVLTQGPSPRRRCKLLGTTASMFLPEVR